MFPIQLVRWLVTLALAATTLLSNADATRAGSPSWSNGCGCGEKVPAAGCVPPQPNAFATRPFWMRPTPSYNSSWSQVPVTNYQTQVVNDPLSGVAVTTLRPCNTYESQMRRTAGCSLWQCFVNWWNSRCRCIGSQVMSPAMTTCTPSCEWVVTSPESIASPYYAPSTNGRLVPVPSSASPTAPVPADRPPQLDPFPPRPLGDGSASRLSPPDTGVFVRMLDGPEPSLDLVPPIVAPGSRDAEVADDLDRAPLLLDANPNDQTASVGETSPELVPVSWSIPIPFHERKLPTNEVWDDTGWQSER